jgi:predicted Rossmann-fold nucleotide-binding protein
VQTQKSQRVPILLFGTAYWKKIVNFEALVEEGAISKQDLDWFQFVDEPAQAWAQIKNFHQL